MTNALFGFAVAICTLVGLLVGPSFVAKPEVVAVKKPMPMPTPSKDSRTTKESQQILKNLQANIEANGKSIDNAVAKLPARRNAAFIGAGVGLVLPASE